jgi:hypothetical protein
MTDNSLNSLLVDFSELKLVPASSERVTRISKAKSRILSPDTDFALLARYTRCRSEDAFEEIVQRYLDFVHSAANGG